MEKKFSPAAERISAFFDAGTFVETAAFLCRSEKAAQDAGVICGYGSVEGRLVFAFAQDASAMHGAVDASHAAKIEDLYKKALRAGAPIVGLFDSAGAMVFDGAAALGAYGRLLAVSAKASGKIPQIAVISGTCTGMMATLAAGFDLLVAVKDTAKMYLAPAADASAVCGAEELLEMGIADVVAQNAADAAIKVKALLSYLPDCAADGAPADLCADDINRMLDVGEKVSASDAMRICADAGTLTPLGKDGGCVAAGLAMLGGCSAVVLALDGKLCRAGAEKLLRLVRLAGRFDLPVVSFLNCTGLKTQGTDAAMLRTLAELSRALVSCENAKIVAITGAAVGAGFIFGGARTLGADLVLALPGAEIAALDATTAVAFLWNDQITNETTREMLEAKWRAEVATATNAAATGEVDDVIAPAELRARVIAGLYMLVNKRGL